MDSGFFALNTEMARITEQSAVQPSIHIRNELQWKPEVFYSTKYVDSTVSYTKGTAIFWHLWRGGDSAETGTVNASVNDTDIRREPEY